MTAGGLHYDALVIATGSVAREIPQLPLGMPHVHYLRTEADAQQLKAALRQCQHLLVDRRRPDRARGRRRQQRSSASGRRCSRWRRASSPASATRRQARSCMTLTGSMASTISVGTALVSSVCRADAVEAVTTAGDVIVADLVVVGTGVAAQRPAGCRRRTRDRRRHRCRRVLPDVRPGDLCGRRRRAVSRAAWACAPGELAPRAGSRHGRRPQCRRREHAVCHRPVVLVRAVRPLHPGRRLASRLRQNASGGPAGKQLA